MYLNLGDTSLLLHESDAFGDFPARKMLDCFEQFGRIPLAYDLVYMRGLHSAIYHLLKRLSGLDTLMLSDVSNEQLTVAGFELGEEVPYLFRADKT